jgi:dUTP pyrophosphatase
MHQQKREVRIKKTHPDAKIPKYAKSGDAAVDLTAVSYEYKDGRHVYGTGLAFEIPPGFVGLIFPRSSICKYDLRLTNCVGVIDSGYRGEVKAFFEDRGMFGDSSSVLRALDNKNIYKVGDRIAQMMIIPYPEISFIEVKELSETERGSGGFGHSGT